MRLLQAARLSRLGDASTGIEKQDEEARRYADANGHEIIGTAADTDVSGDTDPWSRPELGQWLTDAEQITQYDGIVASHVDRLARSSIHFMRLLHWADDHGKRIITTGENGVDFSTPVGKLLGYIISWLGEQELAAIKRRNRETTAWLNRNDFLTGKPPFGYRIAPHPAAPGRKTLVPDPELLPTLREMVDRALRGDTLISVAKWLDTVAPPRHGGLWASNSVVQILRNPILYGQRKPKNKPRGKTLLRVEPVIDLPTWKRLQAKLDENGKRRGGVANTPALLTGLAYCGKCGRKMYYGESKSPPRKDGTRNVHAYYRCMGTHRERSTCRNMVPAGHLNDWVGEEFILDQFGGREIVQRVTVPGGGHEDELERVALDMADLLERFTSDEVTDAEYDAQMAVLRAERTRIRGLPAEPDQVEQRGTGVTVAEHWQALDTAGRREYLLSAGVQISAVKHEEGFVQIELTAGTPDVLWES